MHVQNKKKNQIKLLKQCMLDRYQLEGNTRVKGIEHAVFWHLNLDRPYHLVNKGPFPWETQNGDGCCSKTT